MKLSVLIDVPEAHVNTVRKTYRKETGEFPTNEWLREFFKPDIEGVYSDMAEDTDDGLVESVKQSI
jgi:hypothetical protein